LPYNPPVDTICVPLIQVSANDPDDPTALTAAQKCTTIYRDEHPYRYLDLETLKEISAYDAEAAMMLVRYHPHAIKEHRTRLYFHAAELTHKSADRDKYLQFLRSDLERRLSYTSVDKEVREGMALKLKWLDMVEARIARSKNDA